MGNFRLLHPFCSEIQRILQINKLQMVTKAVRRFWAHEWRLACLGGLVLAAVMTWPTLRDPRRTIPMDLGDPLLQAWQLAWSGHVLRTQPTELWHTNTFYPSRWSFAFSDTLLGYFPVGLVGSGPADAILRYNVLYVLLHALAFVGTYALLRQLGTRPPGAAAGAAAFAYAPYRLAQAGHMHILSSGGIVLALALLARGHGWSLRHGYQSERTHAGSIIAGWAVAAWQMSLGFGIGLPFAYILLLVGLVSAARYCFLWWRQQRPAFGLRLLLANLTGGVLFATMCGFMGYPYLQVVEEHPYARRSADYLELFSPPLSGFFTAPAQSYLWGDAHQTARDALSWPGEQVVLPGFVLLGLAIAGLVVSIWTERQRLWLIGGVITFSCLAMGTKFFGGQIGYMLLFKTLPFFDAIRTPGRLVLYVTLLLCVLAAGAISAFANQLHELANTRRLAQRGILLWLGMVLPMLLVLADCASFGKLPHPEVPPQPNIMRVAPGPMLVLPSDGISESMIMLWTTDRFPEIANGLSGFTTQQLEDIRQVAQNFPDPGSVEYLRGLGFSSVVVIRDMVVGTPWEPALTAPAPEGVTREVLADGVIFHLR